MRCWIWEYTSICVFRMARQFSELNGQFDERFWIGWSCLWYDCVRMHLSIIFGVFFFFVYRLDDCAQFRFDCIYEDWRHYEWWASASGPLPRTIGRRTVLCVNKKNLVGILAQQTGSSYLPRWYNYIIAVRHFIFIFLLICQPIKFVCLYIQPIDLPVMVITCQTVRFVCVHPDGVRFFPFCPGAWRALNITGILLSFQYQRHCHCCAAIGA